MKSSNPSNRLFSNLLHATLALGCVALIIFGAMRMREEIGLASLAVGVLGLIVIGAMIPVIWSLREIRQRDASNDTQPGGTPSTSFISKAAESLLSQIYENSMLSDNAKRVLFRERELELLRRAIEEDIAHGDYSSGLTLCDDMANLFGHREEAEAFRTRILQAGHESYEAIVHQTMDNFDQILSMRDWAGAHREAARIRRLYPNHHLVLEIDHRIMHAREDHKRELEAQFLEAATRDDVASAMTMLKQLDRYLTREEAGRLAEVAQGVVVKHRDNLSMQFKMAVNEHRWAEAAQIGDTIMAEYPNAKMADEVRSMIDVLRVRASQAAVMAEG